MNGRTVWVTGLGVVSAAGSGAGKLLSLLASGASGVSERPELGGRLAGRAPDPPGSGLGRRLDRSARMFLAAAREAWSDAGLSEAAIDADRCALLEGSSLGPMAELLDAHTACARTGPAARGILTFMMGAGGAAFSQERGLGGSILHLSAGSVSAACAVGEAYGRIARGEADLAVAGGAECPLHPDVVGTFAAAGILAGAGGGDAFCRPFDARRTGTVLGEGAAVFILEAEDHATRRAAKCAARVAGFGLTCEGHSMVAPDPGGAGVARAVLKALGGDSPAGIDWIKAHGTGTMAGDEAECRGLAAVLGDRLSTTPLTALKPALGHCLGASGAVEMAACVLALRAGFIPAALGTEGPDPALQRLRLVRTPEPGPARSVLLLSESFGGRCAALRLARAG